MTAPAGRRRGARADAALLEAFSTTDASSQGEPQGDLEPAEDACCRPPSPQPEPGVDGDARRLPLPEERDFVHAVYGNFGWVLLFVIVLTFILLTRAFRSIVLPAKAVILNLISLGCAYGVVVFIFQQGHGSEALWNVQATGVVISWIPLMIFAFLYGISMDYEVFMITRIREAYDETSRHEPAISLGLARTGKLITSGAGVLMFAFFALSTGPGLDIKLFGIGLAAGVIIDATLIRLLLVPSSMQLLGRWNWWLPAWTAKVLRTTPSPLEPRARRTGRRRPTPERWPAQPVAGRGAGATRPARPSPRTRGTPSRRSTTHGAQRGRHHRDTAGGADRWVVVHREVCATNRRTGAHGTAPAHA